MFDIFINKNKKNYTIFIELGGIRGWVEVAICINNSIHLSKSKKNDFILKYFFLLHTVDKCKIPLHIRTFEMCSLKI
jgi:hypothetical protein